MSATAIQVGLRAVLRWGRGAIALLPNLSLDPQIFGYSSSKVVKPATVIQGTFLDVIVGFGSFGQCFPVALFQRRRLNKYSSAIAERLSCRVG